MSRSKSATCPAHPPIDITLLPYTPEWARDFQRERHRLAEAFASDPECQQLIPMKLVIDHYSEIRDGTWKGPRFTFPDRSVCRQEAKRIFVECLSHVGSTSVPGATAKPYIDMKYDIYDRDLRHQVAFCTVSADLSIVACDNVFGSPFFERQGYCQYGRKIQQQPEPYKLDQRYWYRHSRDESSACKGYFIHIGREPMAAFALELRSDASLVQQYNEAKRRIVADHPLISFADYTMLKTAFIQRVLSSRFDSLDASNITCWLVVLQTRG